MKRALSIALLLAISCAPLAHAGPDYSAQTIIEHFSKPKGPDNQPPSAATRSVYLGASGFSASDKADTSSEAFNLLVTFEYDSDKLTPAARRNLDEFAKALKNSSLHDARFMIEGYTDATGPADYNLDLSRRRAQSVVNYLVAKGVGRDRLVPKGYGETNFKSDRPDDQINRRVETRLIE
jgi:outer membrane protein OmpA-like peptidoglycan-associated protein